MGYLCHDGALRFFLAVSMILSCMLACDEKVELPSASTVVLSGRVVDMLAQAGDPDNPENFVVPGATVALEHDERVKYVTGEDGMWYLTVPNDGSDPFVKVTGAGVANSYLQIPVGTSGISKMDIPTVNQLFFSLLFFAGGGQDITKGCMILGPTAGFTNAEWPQEYDMIQGTRLQAVPNVPPFWEGPNTGIHIQYWSVDNILSDLLGQDIPWPDPNLTTTSNIGLWAIIVPDATEIDSIGVWVVEELVEWDVTQPGPDPQEELKWLDGWLHAINQPTRPNGFVTSGTIYYLYESPCVPADPCAGIAHVDDAYACFGAGTDGDYGCVCEKGYVWDQNDHECVPE